MHTADSVIAFCGTKDVSTVPLPNVFPEVAQYACSLRLLSFAMAKSRGFKSSHTLSWIENKPRSMMDPALVNIVLTPFWAAKTVEKYFSLTLEQGLLAILQSFRHLAYHVLKTVRHPYQKESVIIRCLDFYGRIYFSVIQHSKFNPTDELRINEVLKRTEFTNIWKSSTSWGSNIFEQAKLKPTPSNGEYPIYFQYTSFQFYRYSSTIYDYRQRLCYLSKGFTFFTIFAANSRTVLTFTTTLKLKPHLNDSCCCVPGKLHHFSALHFRKFPTFLFAGNTLHPNNRWPYGIYTPFYFSRYWFLLTFPSHFTLQFCFAISYFVAWFFAVVTIDESSWHRCLPTISSTPTIQLLILVCNW